MEIFIVAIILCTRILYTLAQCSCIQVRIYFSKHGTRTTLRSGGGTTIMGCKHYTKCVCRVHFVDWYTNTYIHIEYECMGNFLPEMMKSIRSIIAVSLEMPINQSETHIMYNVQYTLYNTCSFSFTLSGTQVYGGWCMKCGSNGTVQEETGADSWKL